MAASPNHSCNKYYLSLVFVFFQSFSGGYGYSQVVTPDVLNFLGWNYEQNTAIMTISLGEVAVHTISGNGGIITQGFLQPEIKPPCSDFKIDYYPNPVIDFITIRDEACGKLIDTIEIVDMYGKQIMRTRLDNRTADLRFLGVGLYIVRTYSAQEDALGSFKIVKIAN
ncbi:MAG: T9SS type A sorting domain-containing protein [Bacteroidetes bacterium]|nr:T9SS type A sorting domain-containing protein [Bacteroidota bacterium]